MRVMVTGAGGMTGSELNRQALERGWRSDAFDRKDLDICDSAAVLSATREAAPDLVINAAAYTSVDAAEHDEERAMEINGVGAGNVSRAAASVGASVIQISTDYVFDGQATVPYQPGDAVNPLNAYGRSKLAGEVAVRQANPRHAVVRTSWVYSHQGRNFVRTMIRLGSSGSDLRIVEDQHGCPTASSDLAAALLTAGELLHRHSALSGTYHFTNAGATNWYEFARAVFEMRGGRIPVIQPVPSLEYPTPALRPAWSVLDCSSFESAFGVTPRPWRAALHDVLERMQ
jgi:dTDP-4-dehydrorhamnose reductase